MDVDGTLTDGKIYMGNSGEVFKAFNVKDGCGIFLTLPKYGIKPIVITARNSKIVENRCSELNIHELYQGVSDKLSKLNQVVDGELASVAYIGDDIPDIPCMVAVKQAGGVVLCPFDAIPEILAISNYISCYYAGNGAVRDCINYITRNLNSSITSEINNVVQVIRENRYSGGYINDNPYFIQEYQTKDESECLLESHRNHIDIQYIIEGTEYFRLYSTIGLNSSGVYDRVSDTDYWNDGLVTSHSLLVPSSLVVVYNGQPHKGGICSISGNKHVKKLVCKVAV